MTTTRKCASGLIRGHMIKAAAHPLRPFSRPIAFRALANAGFVVSENLIRWGREAGRLTAILREFESGPVPKTR
jgi:hypothetical protein